MQINELSQDQVDLMLQIYIETPIFSVAKIPKMHKDYPTKHEHYEIVTKHVEYLESLAFVKDISNISGDHQRLKEAAEKISGYRYRIFVITEDGTRLSEAMFIELEKELKYKHSIN